MAAAMAAQAAFGERMAALTARVAVLESASPQCDASDSAAQLALPHRASVETPELAELQQRVADLSMMVASSASVAGAASEAVLLSFMDATSSCLSAHEQQLDALQARTAHLHGTWAVQAPLQFIACAAACAVRLPATLASHAHART